MKEIWKDIEGFPGYQVSNTGQVRSFWRKKHYPTGYGTYRYLSDEPFIMSQSDDGNDYMKLMLYSEEDNRRYCKKVHRLVAEAFIEHDDHDDTVDHIKPGNEGKLDNCVSNLQWMPRPDNIKKAYRDGMCDERIKRQEKDIIAVDLWTGEEWYYSSIGEAAQDLKLDRSSISHVLRGDASKASHYTFEYAGREERLLYGHEYYQRVSWL